MQVWVQVQNFIPVYKKWKQRAPLHRSSYTKQRNGEKRRDWVGNIVNNPLYVFSSFQTRRLSLFSYLKRNFLNTFLLAFSLLLGMYFIERKMEGKPFTFSFSSFLCMSIVVPLLPSSSSSFFLSGNLLSFYSSWKNYRETRKLGLYAFFWNI